MKTINLEAMLLRWSETSNGGATIVLQLADPDDLEQFKLMTLAKGKIAGQRLQCVMVEIGDDELPKDLPDPGKGGPLSILAARWCQDSEFQSWAMQMGAETWETKADEPEDRVKEWLRALCGVSSRRELDHDNGAAHKFDAYIRKPYMDHLQSGNRFVP